MGVVGHVLRSGIDQWERPDSNRQPIDYESTALPLSYFPRWAQLDQSSNSPLMMPTESFPCRSSRSLSESRKAPHPAIRSRA